MKANKELILTLFKCQCCGRCCRRPDGVATLSPQQVEAIAVFVKRSVSVIEFINQYLIKDRGWWVMSSCRHRPDCFLDEQNRCQIYPVRPDYCQTYPDWPEVWESEATLSEEIKVCPALAHAYKQSLKKTV